MFQLLKKNISITKTKMCYIKNTRGRNIQTGWLIVGTLNQGNKSKYIVIVRFFEPDIKM